MKKFLLVLFAITAFTFTSDAQFNLKAGINSANQSYSSAGISFSPGARIGFLLGANYSSSLSESLSLRPGIQFNVKGSEVEFLGVTASSSFNYLEIPIDLVYSSSKASLHAGPYLGFLMSASADGEDIKDEAKSLDFGLNLGLGYNFGKIGLGANYGIGISNISEDTVDDVSVTNNYFALYITYAL